MSENLSIKIGSLQLKNPVILASGTCGYGIEMVDFIDLNLLGAVVVKGLTIEPRLGNPYPRAIETASGMLNAVGLQNIGVKNFIADVYPKLKSFSTHFIVNINGNTIEDYIKLAEILSETDIPAIEVNISCPNVKAGGMAFGVSCEMASLVVSNVRRTWSRTMIVKLSPNVSNISEIARSVEEAGADAISLVNTFLAMSIDIHSKKPKLSTITGGLSGPAIKPIALRMVWETAKTVKIPVIGIGGIMNAEDAIEFLLAGASAIQIGTANFINPRASIEVIRGIENYLLLHSHQNISEIIGALKI